MIQENLVEIWFVITIFAAIIILVVRHHRNQKLRLSFQEAFDLGIGVFGGISGFYLIYQVYNLKDELHRLVGNEGRVAMILGGAASLWFGFAKIKELIDKP